MNHGKQGKKVQNRAKMLATNILPRRHAFMFNKLQFSTVLLLSPHPPSTPCATWVRVLPKLKLLEKQSKPDINSLAC